jgi:signal transduction histidine kinase
MSEPDAASLAGRLIAAEQDERRRIALFLHDGAVQSLSGIALMLDAAVHAIDDGRLEDAKRVIEGALTRHRETIRSLRDLSFNLEPVVLRDQGFVPAVRALAEQIGLSSQVQIDLDLGPAEDLTEQAQVTLYQIIREALTQAVLRGPPTRAHVRIEQTPEGEVSTEIYDDGADERRQGNFDALAERARVLSGRVEVDRIPEGGGTRVHVYLPAYAAKR